MPYFTSLLSIQIDKYEINAHFLVHLMPKLVLKMPKLVLKMPKMAFKFCEMDPMTILLMLVVPNHCSEDQKCYLIIGLVLPQKVNFMVKICLII